MATTPGGRLIVLCGLAGSGKTTLAKQLEADGAPRIDPALVAFWDSRVQRPDADELALFD